MFNNCINSKKQGDVGLANGITYFVFSGYTVSIPLTDSQGYDMVVEKFGILNRVQVKTSSFKKNENFSVDLRTKGGNKSGTGKVKKLDKFSADLLFILTSDGTKYLIPITDTIPKSILSLSKEYDSFKV